MADARQELIELRRLAELEQKAAPKAPEKGFMESAADFFSPFPSQQQAGENLDSYKAMLAAGAQGITGGKADEMFAALSAAGAVPVTGAIDVANRLGADIPNPLAGKGISEGMGQAYDAALEQNRAGYKEAVAGHPYAEAAGVIGGSIYNPINKIIPTGGGMIATGAQGALLGADYGFSSGEGGFRERAASAIEQGLVGGALGAAGGAVASGAKYVAGKVGNKINPAPKAQEILDKYVEVKDYAQKTGGVISPRALTVTLRVMDKKVPKSKVGIARAAKEGSAVTEARDFLSQFKGKPLSFDDVEEADKYISNLITAEYTAKKGATGDAVALKDIQETFRRMVAKDAPAGSGFKAKRDAQFLYTQKSKISELEAIIDRASRTDNPATSLKNQLNQLLNNKKAVRSFTEKERKLIRDAVETGKGTEVLRAAGSRLVPIAQVAMGDFTGAAAQVAASDIARKTAGAIQIEKLNRVINEISRTAEGKIRTINYLNKPPSALPNYPKAADIPEMRPLGTRKPAREIRVGPGQPKPEPQKLLPAPSIKLPDEVGRPTLDTMIPKQKLLPAPRATGEMAVTRRGQAVPLTGTESAQNNALRQAMQKIGRLEALRAKQPPIQNFPDPRAPKAAEIPDGPNKAIIEQAYSIKNALKGQFSGDIEKEAFKQLGYKPKSLTQFVKERGGVTNSGEFSGRDVTNRTQVGLVRNKGAQIDTLKRAAHERGYFPSAKDYNDISDSEFIDALTKDAQGSKVYPFEDVLELDRIKQGLMPDTDIEQLGITKDMTVEEIADRILESEKPIKITINPKRNQP